MRRSYIKEPLGEQRTMYEAYCEIMLDVIKRNRDVVMVYADFPKGSVGDFLEKNNPDRVIDLGIAEANVMATSGGLAAAGKVPFTHCHAIFGIGRGYNAIRQ